MTDRTVQIPEVVMPGMRLGRNIDHDDRSKAFPAMVAALQTARHERRCPPFDQGQLGSCTGNAMAGALMTDPLYQPGRDLSEKDAVELYAEATRLDRFPGVYPPDDTGSSGLAVAKAAKREGYISAYRHAFGLQQALGALVVGPVITGVKWYSSFDQPLATGEVQITADAFVRGGHEFEVNGIDVENRRVWCVQSWGPTWGGLGDGTFWMSWDTWDKLLQEQGDVVQLTA
ncbi:MAG TPA: hypothetical protein VJT31_19220 [Rugosimonospora sp.]|nr:hypothetical protein [Rugosimonospora sp.]